MPRKKEWIQRLPVILERLELLPPSLLDRAAVESLFQVSSRQATRILNQLGARQTGGAWVIEHQDLLNKLRNLQLDPGVVFEHRRRSRLQEHLESVRKELRGRRIPIAQDASQAQSIEALPADIRLSPTRLEISFSTPVDLLEKMMHLTHSIQEDWVGFESMTSTTPPRRKAALQ